MKKPHFTVGTGMPDRERFGRCEVPSKDTYFLHTVVLVMPSRPIKYLALSLPAELLRGDGVAMETERTFSAAGRTKRLLIEFPFITNGFCNHMDNLSGYARRPFPFVLRYLRQRLASHVVILTAVIAAVACSVGTQYGVKYLVDSLSAGATRAGGVWLAFIFLMSLDRGR